MKIVVGSTDHLETLKFAELIPGEVYTNVSDDLDDDLFIKTDAGAMVRLKDGVVFVDGDLPTARFLEVDVELVVKK